MDEKLLEKKLREEVRSLGGLALKFVSPGFTGVPDRLVLTPGGNMYFVELKTTGQKLRHRQKYVVEQLQKLGFSVYVIDSKESLYKFLREVMA